MPINKIYKELLKTCRRQKVSVRHVSLSNISGNYCCETHRICISKELKGTKEGCRVLAHEIMHHKDNMRGIFVDFFWGIPKDIERVKKAELSASRQAHKLLLSYGLDVDYEEFDFEKHDYLIEHYREYYF